MAIVCTLQITTRIIWKNTTIPPSRRHLQDRLFILVPIWKQVFESIMWYLGNYKKYYRFWCCIWTAWSLALICGVGEENRSSRTEVRARSFLVLLRLEGGCDSLYGFLTTKQEAEPAAAIWRSLHSYSSLVEPAVDFNASPPIRVHSHLSADILVWAEYFLDALPPTSVNLYQIVLPLLLSSRSIASLIQGPASTCITKDNIMLGWFCSDSLIVIFGS